MKKLFNIIFGILLAVVLISCGSEPTLPQGKYLSTSTNAYYCFEDSILYIGSIDNVCDYKIYELHYICYDCYDGKSMLMMDEDASNVRIRIVPLKGGIYQITLNHLYCDTIKAIIGDGS